MIGEQFGEWTVLSKTKRARYVICKCSCGFIKEVTKDSLKRGTSTKCRSCARTKHGQTGTPEWKAWSSMRERCLNPSNAAFDRYGGAGITICPSWDSFETFFKDMGPRPTGGSLDRINPFGNYEPGNCRWVSSKAQQANRQFRKILDKQLLAFIRKCVENGLSDQDILLLVEGAQDGSANVN